jgi:phage baseplate assembly protein W
MGSGIGFKPDRKIIEDVTTVGFIKEDARLVAESIHRIVNTRPGEKPRDPLFGCRIQEVLFEPNDFSVATLGAYYISDAIDKFEPRVTIEEINVTLDRNTNGLVAEIIFKLVNDPTKTFRTVSIIGADA